MDHKTPKAVLVFREKYLEEAEVVIEIKVWKVPKSDNFPEGLKYSLFAVRVGGEVLVGYDNHPPKGHHRHYLGKEGPYEFRGVSETPRRF